MSTFLSVQGTAMTPQFVMTHVHLPLLMGVESSRIWKGVSGWVVSRMSEDCSAFIFNGWTLKDGASHQTWHHILQYSHPQQQPCENLKSLCWLPLFYYVNFSPCYVLALPLSQLRTLPNFPRFLTPLQEDHLTSEYWCLVGCGIDHPPHLAPSLEEYNYTSTPFWAFMALSRVNFPFLPLSLVLSKLCPIFFFLEHGSNCPLMSTSKE